MHYRVQYGRERRHMVRLSSFLMVILLAAPMMAECCFVLTRTLPSNHSGHEEDPACYWSEQAVAEAKGMAARTIASNGRLPVPMIPVWQFSEHPLYRMHKEVAVRPQPRIELYLLTEALLI